MLSSMVALLASGSLLVPTAPKLEPAGACTTFVSILIWSETSEELFRVTVPVDCSIARAMEYDEELASDFSLAPFRFEQHSATKDWHAVVQMKDFVGSPRTEE